MISFKPQYTDAKDVKTDIRMYLKQTPVPVADSSKWTFDDWTVGSDGHLKTNVDVGTGKYAERYIPGILDGHLYTITIVVGAATVDGLIITWRGQTLATITTADTYIYRVRPTTGGVLRFETAAGIANNWDISSIVIEAEDPMNSDLIPETTPKEV